MQVVTPEGYSVLVFLQVLVVHIIMNQAWTALFIALLCAFPGYSFQISPIITSIAEFTSGCFIETGNLHWGYVQQHKISVKKEPEFIFTNPT